VLRAVGIGASNFPDPAALVDRHGHVRTAYDVRGEALVLVRPDGYIGLFARPGSIDQLDTYLSQTIGAPPFLDTTAQQGSIECGIARAT
jgi:hypothetical protein